MDKARDDLETPGDRVGDSSRIGISRRAARSVFTWLLRVIVLDEAGKYKDFFASQRRWMEADRLWRSGARVPNALFRPAPSKSRHSGRAIYVFHSAAVITFYLSTLIGSGNTPPQIRPVLIDAATLFTLMLLALPLPAVLLNDRALSLWYLRSMRRRYGLSGARPAPVWVLGLLLGLAVYVVMFALAGGYMTGPGWTLQVAVAAGHARVLPILLFPWALHLLYSRHRRSVWFSPRRRGGPRSSR